MVKKAAIKQTVQYLNKIKEKHSKLDDIAIEDFKTQEYLTDDRINLNQIKMLFKLRTRMFEYKQNFTKNKYSEHNRFCDLCKVCIDSQSHLLECFVLKNCNEELRNNKLVKYEHIFDDVELQIPAIKLISKITMTREILLEKL